MRPNRLKPAFDNMGGNAPGQECPEREGGREMMNLAESVQEGRRSMVAAYFIGVAAILFSAFALKFADHVLSLLFLCSLGGLAVAALLHGLRKMRMPKRVFGQVFGFNPESPKIADKKMWERDSQALVVSLLTELAREIRVGCYDEDRLIQEAKTFFTPYRNYKDLLTLKRENDRMLYKAKKKIRVSKQRFERARNTAEQFGFKVKKSWTDYESYSK